LKTIIIKVRGRKREIDKVPYCIGGERDDASSRISQEMALLGNSTASLRWKTMVIKIMGGGKINRGAGWRE
jgi:hypothetical protein